MDGIESEFFVINIKVAEIIRKINNLLGRGIELEFLETFVLAIGTAALSELVRCFENTFYRIRLTNW